MKDQTEDEALTLACMQRALDDSWPDGKHRLRLKRVMAERFERLRRQTGYQTLDALRRADPATYERFLAGSRRAMIRDGLISEGLLGPEQLGRMREAFETRGLHEAFDEPDRTAERYG